MTQHINDNNQGTEAYPTWETKPAANSKSALDTEYSTGKSSLEVPTNTTATTSNSSSTDPASSADLTASRTPRDQQRNPSSASGNTTSSRSRSRGSSAWDAPRASTDQNLWQNDKERKHRQFMDKVLGNKLVPHFLE